MMDFIILLFVYKALNGAFSPYSQRLKICLFFITFYWSNSKTLINILNCTVTVSLVFFKPTLGQLLFFFFFFYLFLMSLNVILWPCKSTLCYLVSELCKPALPSVLFIIIRSTLYATIMTSLLQRHTLCQWCSVTGCQATVDLSTCDAAAEGHQTFK